jgi:ribonuclease D
MTMQPYTTVRLLHGDLTGDLAESLRTSGLVAWDTETTGLDWRNDRLATCQLWSARTGAVIVRMNEEAPFELPRLLADPDVLKVFHHAPFDLRFMFSTWGAMASNVACTKVASKLLHPERHNGDHSLKPVLEEYLDVHLDKTEQVSNWLSATLTSSQLEYAARDVQFLLPLYESLNEELRHRGLLDLASRCFAFLPARVSMDLLGYGDVFSY